MSAITPIDNIKNEIEVIKRELPPNLPDRVDAVASALLFQKMKSVHGVNQNIFLPDNFFSTMTPRELLYLVGTGKGLQLLSAMEQKALCSYNLALQYLNLLKLAKKERKPFEGSSKLQTATTTKEYILAVATLPEQRLLLDCRLSFPEAMVSSFVNDSFYKNVAGDNPLARIEKQFTRDLISRRTFIGDELIENIEQAKKKFESQQSPAGKSNTDQILACMTQGASGHVWGKLIDLFVGKNHRLLIENPMAIQIRQEDAITIKLSSDLRTIACTGLHSILIELEEGNMKTLATIPWEHEIDLETGISYTICSIVQNSANHIKELITAQDIVSLKDEVQKMLGSPYGSPEYTRGLQLDLALDLKVITSQMN